jgi:glutamine cyclotransferase
MGFRQRQYDKTGIGLSLDHLLLRLRIGILAAEKHNMLFAQLHRRLLTALVVLLWLLPLQAQEAGVPVYGYKVINAYPHNERSFTQGLLLHDGKLYEGTGRYGQSALMQIDLESGAVVKSRTLSSRYFGEGIAIANNQLFQLTWRENMVFVYDLDTLEPVTSHYWPREGWGLTFNGEQLILSDGSDQLFFIDPTTFQLLKQIPVKIAGQPVYQLNELEYINDEVWANVWMSQQLVRIDPETGQVTAVVDLTGLVNQTQIGGNEAVLNGIAWNAVTEQLFVTGKLWSHLFEIELVPR